MSGVGLWSSSSKITSPTYPRVSAMPPKTWPTSQVQ
eukprot:CAMPEP_0174944744 /NCGR_PEP_ID=MMETSP1355-20121228/79855_1 /TAXON_ID=464990 /ORGANISM="Hemiselmis tepida, Strain CCMP443" /LENGTH=35 /DNA_ID= /DNA_START= /DNA_END= /DNA_ORIENTATION=